MTRKISLELPDDLSQRLEAKAQIINLSVEAMVLKSLEDLAAQPDDPIAPFLGTLSYERDDIASRHDDYIGVTLKLEDPDMLIFCLNNLTFCSTVIYSMNLSV